MAWRIPVVVCVIAALACARTPSAASVSSGDQQLPPGTFRRTLEHDGRERSYLVHLPPQAASGDPLPVILNFHGGGGNAQGQEDYSRMDAVADEAGFIAVYPEGTGRFGGYLLTWNAGGCCGYAQDVELWRLTGAGHVWPGGVPGTLETILGPWTDVIDASREMWGFFERFPVAGG